MSSKAQGGSSCPIFHLLCPRHLRETLGEKVKHGHDFVHIFKGTDRPFQIFGQSILEGGHRLPFIEGRPKVNCESSSKVNSMGFPIRQGF